MNDHEDLEMKAALLREDWLEEIDRGLDFMVPVIKQEFAPDNILALISTPFIDIAAATYIKTAKKIGVKQLDISMACAIEAIKTGDFDGSIDRFFPRFLEHDVLYKNAKKSHPMYQRVIDSLREEFILRIKDTMDLLVVGIDGKPDHFPSVSDVYVATYQSFEHAKAVQEKQIACIEQRIEWVKQHHDLVIVPFGLREKATRVIEKGITYTRERYLSSLERHFQCRQVTS